MKALIIDRVSPVVKMGLESYGVKVDVNILPEREILKKLLPQYDLLVMRVDPKMDKEMLNAAANHIKMIAICSAGTNHVDMEYANKIGITIQNAPGINSNAVAELTLAKMIELSRMTVIANNEVQNEGLWDKYKYTGHELKGHLLGIIGLGHIGKRVATLAQAFGMQTIAYDPYIPDSDFREVNTGKTENLYQICKECDYISVHTPLNKETRGIISKELVEIMKPSAILINCARGGLVDENAIYDALKNKKIAGYGADVLANELAGKGLLDNAKVSSPLFGLNNFIITPHVGGSTHEAYDHIGEYIVHKVVEFYGLKNTNSNI
ncbi:NAD(P)-dependent oxidoreductase [uncultured Acidaminococcus sp.]|uniref:NAD(P)-dependent oxidoreductase n=1 Tax=uncultured Acidaminococcus sp. TaxID=352152 RepID=UPI0026336FBB|nr:NAD(P)-dependent oxidoreductase [uncultured Acidaminococcus sp.]